MRTRTTLVCGFMAILTIVGGMSDGYSQKPAPSAAAPARPGIDVQSYKIAAELLPDAHEFKASAVIVFRPAAPLSVVTLEISENLSIQKVLSAEEVELEFGQDDPGPGLLTIRFPRPLSGDVDTTIRIVFQGGFDRDRYSRMYSRDEGSAYIGMEGSYLMYSAKWFPVSQFLVDKAPSTIEVTVPLGMTVIGPGEPLPVVTKGIAETFGWTAKTPILPGSIVAGQYYQKKVDVGRYTLDCFTKANKPESMQKIAEATGKILEFYEKSYGPPAQTKSFRLVEVDEGLARQPGMLGVIFVTRSELAQETPPVRDLARRIAYQWWQETVGVQQANDMWLIDGMSYFSAAQYIGKERGAAAYKEEIDNLAILALKFEGKSAVREGLGLGFRTDKYESVVAGKGAWIVNMLRGILGDAKFDQLIKQYVVDYSRTGGSSAGFQKLAEQVNGKSLGWFFTEWIDAIGVPDLETEYVVLKTASGFRVSGTVKQDRDLFRMPVEVAVVTSGKDAIKTVELSGKSTAFEIATTSMPKKVVLDPGNKLLRDSKELQTSVQISLGNDLKKNGNFVESIKAFEGALKLDPRRSLAHFRLAEVFYEQFNLQSSANSFRDALNGDRNPKWIEVWCYLYLGKIYDILGQRQRAMAEYTKAVNTKDDTNGAQTEAKKWLSAPFTRERTTMEPEKGKEAEPVNR